MTFRSQLADAAKISPPPGPPRHCAARALAWTLERRVLVGLARPLFLASIIPYLRVILVPAQHGNRRSRPIVQQLSLKGAPSTDGETVWRRKHLHFVWQSAATEESCRTSAVQNTHDTHQHRRLSPRSCALASHTRHARLHHLPLQRDVA